MTLDKCFLNSSNAFNNLKLPKLSRVEHSAGNVFSASVFNTGYMDLEGFWANNLESQYNPYNYEPTYQMAPVSNPFGTVIVDVPSPNINPNANQSMPSLGFFQGAYEIVPQGSFTMPSNGTYMDVFGLNSPYEILNYDINSNFNFNFNSNYPVGPKLSGSLAQKFGTFDEALSYHESRGNYKVENKYGFLGRYQMGEALLHDLGFYKNDGNLLRNDWKGTWSGKYGVKSKQDFLNSSYAQDMAFKEAKAYKWKIIKHQGLDKYIGQTINGVVITPSGLLGGAYAQGAGNLKNYLESNGTNVSKDGNGLTIASAIERYSGFDISGVTG